MSSKQQQQQQIPSLFSITNSNSPTTATVQYLTTTPANPTTSGKKNVFFFLPSFHAEISPFDESNSLKMSAESPSVISISTRPLHPSTTINIADLLNVDRTNNTGSSFDKNKHLLIFFPLE